MDAKDIKDIIETVGRMGITNLELNMEGIRLVIGNNKDSITNKEVINLTGHEQVETEKTSSEDMDLYIVKSPMVGTFYSAPSPGAKPFVKIGSHVNNGDALYIIEAMKVMNEIVAELQGEIIDIFPADGDVLEYGQPVMSIRKK